MESQDTKTMFTKLYNETFNDISKYVICNCSNVDDVSDIIQTIYLEVIKAFPQNIDITEKYIMGIAKNKVRDYYRQKYKTKSTYTVETNVTDIIPDRLDLEKSMLVKYDVDKVWKYLKKKPPVIAKIFYLYYYQELKIKDIATILNLNESRIKNYLYRTLKELKKYMGGKEK